MPKVPWPELLARHPRIHLVIVALPDAERVGPLQAAQNTLSRFIRQRVPAGDFASIIVREGGRCEIHFAFAAELNAGKLADELGAGVVARYPGWASQRAADVSAEKLAAIGAGLAPPRRQSARPGSGD